MSDVEVILPNMHGASVTVGNRTHVLFRVTNSTARTMAKPVDGCAAQDTAPARIPQKCVVVLR